MIHLITGLPGSGKSLLAVELINKNLNSESIRPCYCNINGLDFDALRCFSLDDPERWFDFPDGSIIVIDECQRWFRPRPNGSAVPEAIARMETHRHSGIDLILITQHPRLIDVNVRKLVELHQHMFRPFGMDRRTVLEWNSCNESPEPTQSNNSANKYQKPFDKELFKFYKSATIHTHVKRLPYKKIGIFLSAIALVIFACFKVVSGKLETIDHYKKAEPANDATELSQTAIAKSEVSLNHEASAIDAHQIDRRIFYRGHIKEGTNIEILFSDSEGNSYRLKDFNSYQKNGLEVIFHVSGDLAEVSYVSKDRELLALLP